MSCPRLIASAWILIAVSILNGDYVMSAHSTEPHQSLQNYPDAAITATDTATGTTLSVAEDGRTLVAKDPSGKTLWQNDILAASGEPGAGFPVIRSVAIDGGKASLIVGKSMVVEVDLSTGKVAVLGEN
jgi:hypothetical protein